MPTFVALLRAVNVGNNGLPMERVRALCRELGFENVRTYVQSGNVVFDTMGPPARVAKALEAKLKGEVAARCQCHRPHEAGDGKAPQGEPVPESQGR